MSTPNEPPQSRRAARLAQRAAQGDERHLDDAAVDESGASFGASRPSPTDAIDYRTEVRPRVPRYEPPTPGSPDAASPTDDATFARSASPVAPPFAPPTAPAPGQRVRSRDFGPADRGARPTFGVHQADDAALDYRTQGGPAGAPLVPASATPAASGISAPAHSAPAFSAPAFSAPAFSAPATSAPAHSAPAVDPAFDALDASGAPGLVMPEYTMTRRELRALRAAQGGDQSDEGAASGDDLPAGGPPAGDPFDALLSAPRADAADSSEAAQASPSASPAEPAPLHLWQPTSIGSATPAPLIEPAPPAAGQVATPAESVATGSHWSAGFSEPADDPFENTFSRQVGSASLSTNALVLPEMPVGSLAGPVPGTGEIIITGMVDVPSSIASTGAVPSVHDSPDLDDLVDAGDREFVSTDSAPVSATSAVSSHTATRNVIAGRRPRGNTLTTVLIISTVVMAIAAVTIFVVAAANGLF